MPSAAEPDRTSRPSDGDPPPSGEASGGSRSLLGEHGGGSSGPTPDWLAPAITRRAHHHTHAAPLRSPGRRLKALVKAAKGRDLHHKTAPSHHVELDSRRE